jgi:delta endotoxin, N-terminal domain
MLHGKEIGMNGPEVRIMDDSFNWNSAAEVTITTALAQIPVMGSILSALLRIFWPPSGEEIWAEIKQQVEQLINQAIDQVVYEQVQNSLKGLNNNMTDYVTTLPTNDHGTISATWITTDGDFDQQLPNLQTTGYQVLLLPLFAQFANLHLTLLRDSVLFGSQWEWNAAYLALVPQKLTRNIATYTTYAQGVYQQGYQNVVSSTKSDNHNCQPFRSVNAYVGQMTLSVLDFVQLWPYFDPTTYPKPVTVYVDREIYSNPVGTCDDSGAINLPSPPTQPISQMTVWGWDRIDAAQPTYPPGGGPGGVTQTARMGDQGGG